jgi:hypothetical protein
MMNQAIEQIVEETDGSRTMPNLSRGPEIEITSRQDVERLKALLSQNKIHGITTKTLERAIVMPRDNDAFHPGYLPIEKQLMHNPYKAAKEDKVKRKKKGGDGGDGRLMKGATGSSNKEYQHYLAPNENQEYKLYEVGNFPLRKRGTAAKQGEDENEDIPKNGQYRLKMPADADWTAREADMKTHDIVAGHIDALAESRKKKAEMIANMRPEDRPEYTPLN